MHPFVTIPFSKSELLAHATEDVWPYGYKLSEGYIYSDRYAPLLGHALHAGIDYHVPYGTAIYSPIDGYISGSYSIQRARNEDWSIRIHDGRKITYGLGYCVQLFDPVHHVFLLYGHLSYLSRWVPFQLPHSNDEGELFAKWFTLTHEHIQNISACSRIKPIRKGDYIWDVGVSGIYYTDTLPTITDTSRDRLDQYEYDYYGYPHLHRNTYTRSPEWTKQTPIDPYDIYETYEHYPDHSRPDMNMGKDWLMILGADGLPMFVDE